MNMKSKVKVDYYTIYIKLLRLRKLVEQIKIPQNRLSNTGSNVLETFIMEDIKTNSPDLNYIKLRETLNEVVSHINDLLNALERISGPLWKLCLKYNEKAMRTYGKAGQDKFMTALDKTKRLGNGMGVLKIINSEFLKIGYITNFESSAEMYLHFRDLKIVNEKLDVLITEYFKNAVDS